jgi:Kef-type K+ transport system membrane component KefB
MSVYHAIVPIFFVVMGMMVDVTTMGTVLVFGIVITLLAILGKVVGCGIPAMLSGFNKAGSWRIGIGMLPRGEVALIIAGIGLSRGIIESDIFGVAILMTVITTLLAPIILVPAFKSGGSGRR